MEDRDLEKTKPIKVLKDLVPSEDVETRESKYKDAIEKEEMKIKEEEAEEALAEKNIQLAEEILHEEKEKKKVVKQLEEEIDEELKDTDKVVKKSKDKDSFVVILKDKWNSLNNKQKILIGVLGGILLLLIIVLIILLIFEMFFFKGRPEVAEEANMAEEQLKAMQDYTVPVEQRTVYHALNDIVAMMNNKEYKALYDII